VMFDLISAFCAGLLPLCMANIYFSFHVILRHEYSDDVWGQEKRRFAIAMNLLSIYMLMGCISWLLWDGDIISKMAQYKISLAGRVFAIVGSFLLFLTFSLGISPRNRTLIIIVSVLCAAVTYFFKVFHV